MADKRLPSLRWYWQETHGDLFSPTGLATPLRVNRYATNRGFSILDGYNRTLLECDDADASDAATVQLAMLLCEARYGRD